ncbi:phage holin family protein [Novosphingobium soli]|uniref:Phage holin family protein n=1 Tax=Novosphingobium soli TaxID=574956 RepID=A0ABV6CTZ6_9SPHN
MHDTVGRDLSPLIEDEEDLSLAGDLRQLADEAKAVAHAELTFQKSRAAYVSTASRGIALLLVVALVLLFFALVAAVVGTVIALGPVLGLWGAMALVTVVLLGGAVALALVARSRLSRMMKIVGGKT